MSNEIKTNVTVYLPVPLVRKLNDAARLNACSRSEFVQRIFKEYLDTKNENEKDESK